MDFHCLARKDLQALCKLNKIPANITNVAMAEALSSLNIVKGIEKYCKSAESSVAESSVESPEKDVVTSPKTTRTGRRKQVREGSGVLQTATPVTRRSKRVSSVKTVQRVYNTRLSARLSKKEHVESEKKDIVEAVKINSYCDVVSDNDFGEVLEDKCVPGFDNAGVDLSVPEIEQQNMSVLWKNANKDLDLKDTFATKTISEVLENSVEGFQNLEMPIDNNMVVVDVPFYQKKGDDGVGLSLFETDIVTEVIPNEVKVFQIDANNAETPICEMKAAIPNLSPEEKGSVDVGFSYLKKEVQSGTSERGNGEYLDVQVTALTDMKAVDMIGKGSDYMGVDFSLYKIDQQSESLKSKYADRDLDLKGTAAINMKYELLENNVEGFKIMEMPSHNNMVVVVVPHYQKNVDAGVGLCIFETDNITEVIQNEAKVIQVDANKAEKPTSDMKAATPILSPQVKGSFDFGFSYLTNEVQSGSSERGNSENFDAGIKAVVLNSKGSDNLVVEFPLSEVEQRSESPNLKYSDKSLDFKDTADTNLKPEELINKAFVNVGADSSVPDIEQQSEFLKWKNAIKDLDLKETVATNLESNVLEKNVEGFKMDVVVEMPSHKKMAGVDPQLHKKRVEVVADSSLSGLEMTTEVLKPIGAMPNYDHKAVVDMPHNKLKDDVVVDLSLHEIDSTTEGPANEVELLLAGTEKAEIEMPIQKTKVVEQVFSPETKGSEDVRVHFSFSEESDDVELHFSFLEADKNVDAAVTFSTDNNDTFDIERKSLKEHLNMESSEKVNYSEGIHDMMIHPKSEKVMFECWSSGVNNSVDGENFDIIVKTQEDISCNSESGGVYDESGGVYDDEKGLNSQEEKAIASDPHIYSETNERIENSIHNNSDDDNSIDTDFIQHDLYSKQSDSRRKPVSEIPSCNEAIKFADQLEMKDSVIATNDFSIRVPYVEELGDKESLADDPESNSETFDNNSSDTEAESYFLEYSISSKQQDSDSLFLGNSCIRKSADQSATPESFDSPVCYSNETTSSYQLVSGKSTTKDSRLSVASHISSCFSETKKLSFDKSQQVSEVKSPSSLKLSKQICPSSAPPSLQFGRTKFPFGEPPLLLADHPFTQKVLSGGARPFEPYQFADISNYMPLSSTGNGPTSKLESNISNDKENIEQNELI